MAYILNVMLEDMPKVMYKMMEWGAKYMIELSYCSNSDKM
jgi:hypothetical protein